MNKLVRNQVKSKMDKNRICRIWRFIRDGQKMRLAIALIFLIIMSGCTRSLPSIKPSETFSQKTILQLGYVIQVGAFSLLDNAVRLVESLQNKGLEAYYFPHESGLFKVRFGNYPSRELAKKTATELYTAGYIEDYYIVDPEEYPGGKNIYVNANSLRENIVLTANRFLGIPYRWGGASAKEGFDCSGLVMAVYELNGLALPRTSQQQWAAGDPVEFGQLSKADILFFSTSRDRKITHVGLYIGEGRFIHAPGKGKKIRTDYLSNEYFKKTFMGARTYL